MRSFRLRNLPPGEHVAAELRPGRKLSSRRPHGLEARKAIVGRARLTKAWPMRLPRLGQEPARFQASEPGCRGEVVGRQLQLHMLPVCGASKVLVSDGPDRDRSKIDFVAAREGEEPAERNCQTSDLNEQFRLFPVGAS
jgi:hypothetical protein